MQCPSSSVHFSNNSILFSNIVLCAMFSIRVAGFHAFAHCLWNPRGENQDSNGHRPIRDSLAHCYAMYISLFSGCSNIDNNLLGALRDILLRKYCFSFGFSPNCLPPRPSPQFRQLVQLFWAGPSPLHLYKIHKNSSIFSGERP